MAKESLSAPQKAPIFRETFADEQTTRLLGGVPTSVTYSNGIGSFNGTNSSILYPRTPNGTCSIRIKCTPNNFTGDPVLFYTTSGGIYIYFTATTGVLVKSSGTAYVNGVATTTTTVGVSNDIVITGISLNAASFYMGRNGIATANYLNSSVELFEIYDYTLTANEVANLYNNKRYDDVNTYQLDPLGISYRGPNITGNYIQSSVVYNSNDFDTEFSVSCEYSLAVNRVVGLRSISEGINVAINNTVIAVEYRIGATVYTATAYTGNTPNTIYTVRVTRNSTTGAITVTKNGANITVTGDQVAGALNNGSNIVQVNGVLGGLQGCLGKIYWVKLYTSGVLTQYFNPAIQNINATSWVSTTGETWTVNGSVGTITNVDKQEILNVDAKNGVIANKYNPENLFTYSQDFTNGFWNKGSAVATANVTTAPDGSLTADKFNENTNLDTHQFYCGVTTTAQAYSVSAYFKAAERSVVKIAVDKTSPDPDVIFNLATGTVYSSSNVISSSMTSVGNGWYRCEIVFAAVAETCYPIFRICNSAFSEVYAGTTGYGVYIWGAQLNTINLKPYQATTATIVTSALTNTAVTPIRSGNIWAMNFNGTTSKIDCGSYDTLLGDITLIVWVKPNLTGVQTQEPLANGKFSLQIDNVGYYYFSRTYFSGAYINASNQMKNGVWQMIVVTSTAAGVSIIYKNAVSVASGTVQTPVAGTTNIIINTGASIKSLMSGVRVIKGILSAVEISQLFSNERRNYGV